jgi:PBSX family phage terminase large subunit
VSTLKHFKQIEFLSDQARFKYLLTGRRGGKTTALVEDMLKKMSQCPYRGEIFYIGPTNQQAKELVWEPIEDRLDELGWKYEPKVSKSRFEFQGKRKIYIIGAEKIRRIRGHSVYAAYLDEIAYFDTDLNYVWKAVRPALSDLQGSAIASTTPNGKGTQAYEFFLEVQKKEDWKLFHWNTTDNPFIDQGEILSAKRELDERSFRQEYMATWESFDGLAYYCFDEKQHIKKTEPITDTLPICISLDFNVNPTTLLVSQNHGGMHQFKMEYSVKNSSTVESLRTFCFDFRDYKKSTKIIVYGDAAGNNRNSTTGFSDYYYVKEILSFSGYQFELCVPGRNPPIIDRVGYVNSYLKNVVGETRVMIDPSCSDLIRDLSSQALEGRFPSDKNNLGHKADAFGYYISWQQITDSRKPQGSIQL